MTLNTENAICPCGSGKSYGLCCQPIHQHHSNALIPEQLMRARYSAHVLGLVDFVVTTYHPSCHANDERDGIAESIALSWVKLEVLDAPKPDADEGFVEFKAYLNENDVIECMHERSRFLKEDGLWYYIDGVFPEESNSVENKPVEKKTPKVGRNDPCPCGSGKKYKKCCG